MAIGIYTVGERYVSTLEPVAPHLFHNNELRFIRRNEDRIRRNTARLYQYKLAHGNDDRLAARCNDFSALEQVCEAYRA